MQGQVGTQEDSLEEVGGWDSDKVRVRTIVNHVRQIPQRNLPIGKALKHGSGQAGVRLEVHEEEKGAKVVALVLLENVPIVDPVTRMLAIVLQLEPAVDVAELAEN